MLVRQIRVINALLHVQAQALIKHQTLIKSQFSVLIHTVLVRQIKRRVSQLLTVSLLLRRAISVRPQRLTEHQILISSPRNVQELIVTPINQVGLQILIKHQQTENLLIIVDQVQAVEVEEGAHILRAQHVSHHSRVTSQQGVQKQKLHKVAHIQDQALVLVRGVQVAVHQLVVRGNHSLGRIDLRQSL